MPSFLSQGFCDSRGRRAVVPALVIFTQLFISGSVRADSGAPGSAADATAAAAPASSSSPQQETLSEHRLRELSERQRTLLAEAAAAGAGLDATSFRSQVETLAHDYETFLRTNGDNAAGFANYGYLLWKVGMRKEAVGLLLKANSIDPNIPMVKNELGNFLAEEGKPLEALEYFLSAVKLAPGEPLYHYELGKLLYEAREDFIASGEWRREALDHAMLEGFRRAAELAPDRIEYTYRYAESFADVQNPDWNGALKQWRTLEAQSGSEAERQTMLLQEANVLLHQGRRDEASAVLDRVTLPGLQGQKQKLVAPAAAAPEK